MSKWTQTGTMLALLALTSLSPLASGCNACSEDEAVTGKQKATGDASADAGALSGLDGGDGQGVDGAAGDAEADADAAADATADAADVPAPPKPCATNSACDAKELCGLFYNGVEQLLGDPQPNGGKKLPAWANICVERPKTGAAEGQSCDPYGSDTDATLPACVNQSACMQGLCTGLCMQDADCPKGAICGVTESGVAVKDGAAAATAWLSVDICLPMPGPGTACERDADCTSGAACRPLTRRAGAGLSARGHCVQPEAGKAAVGAACGAATTATGLGKLCATSLCMYETTTIAGTCSATCSTSTDCPATMSWNGVAYPTACAAIRNNRGIDGQSGGSASGDDIYWPHCVLVNQQSSLKDCATSRACAEPEACLPYAIAWGPDVGAKIEYRCIQQKTTTLPGGPTLDDGASCELSKSEHGCKGGLCLADAIGKGRCGRLCLDDSTCGGGLTCKDRTLIPRADAAKAAVTKACQP